MKPKRAQKASDRLVSSRKKLRKEDGVRANEALLKQLKQVTPRGAGPVAPGRLGDGEPAVGRDGCDCRSFPASSSCPS